MATLLGWAWRRSQSTPTLLAILEGSSVNRREIFQHPNALALALLG
ncbi:MAG: hypothetical protein IPO43_01995 [Rhodoferax sp.]|nr:hypothetical protein [Rhodoferax sp.]